MEFPQYAQLLKMDIEYFKDIESDALYAGMGPMAGHGLFRLPNPQAGSWEFLIPESPDWDDAHQRIYRNFRVTRVKPEELPKPLPPLPEVPSGPFPEWKRYFLPARPIKAWRYPRIAKLLKARPDAALTVFVVLSEDRYETVFGDGEFHYLDDVFLTQEEAQAYITKNEKEWTQFHLRTFSFHLEGKILSFPDFQPQRYDHFKITEVLHALETRSGRWFSILSRWFIK